MEYYKEQTVRRSILSEYVDACELIRETEADLMRIKRDRKDLAVDSVKGSNPVFPYEPRVFRIEGVGYDEYKRPDEQRKIEAVLEERREKAKQIRLEVDAWVNTIPTRMQRIVRARYFQNKTWDAVSRAIGAASADAVRMEFERFMRGVDEEW